MVKKELERPTSKKNIKRRTPDDSKIPIQFSRRKHSKKLFTPKPLSVKPPGIFLSYPIDGFALLLEQQNYKVDGNCAKTSIGKIKRSTIPHKAQSSALVRAGEVQSSLDSKFPSFIKYMLRSHVSSCFWMGLPVKFCQSYLPKQDVWMTLVDENAQEYPIKYLAGKTGLSAGWRGFSVAQKLAEGDVMIFHLIDAEKFKVYILRASRVVEVDGSPRRLSLDATPKQNDSEEDHAVMSTEATKKSVQKRIKSCPLSTLLQNKRNSSYPTMNSENDTEVVGSQSPHGIRFSESRLDFEDMKNLESFTIVVNGLVIDSEISEHTRKKYYELCCAQKVFLHKNLLDGLNEKLVAGMIYETVNIADFIKASNLTTSQDEFARWDKRLIAFEQMGMNVGLLRSRLQKVGNLSLELEQSKDLTRLKEAKIEQARVHEQIRTIEAKLVELKEMAERLQAETETLKGKSELLELEFEDAVNAPW